jgi:hypothetical protein
MSDIFSAIFSLRGMIVVVGMILIYLAGKLDHKEVTWCGFGLYCMGVSLIWAIVWTGGI